jgi:hypothetical protein
MKQVWQPLSVHTQRAFLRILRNAGLDESLAQSIIDLPPTVLADRIISLLREEVFEPSEEYKRARSIMGTNFFGIEAGFIHFGIRTTREERLRLSCIPFSESTLRAVRDTHLLVALLPCSIVGIRERVAPELFSSQRGAWYDKRSFATYVCAPTWCLIRKETPVKQMNQTWAEQYSSLMDTEEVPTVQALVYAVIGNFLATGERLFKTGTVRTATIDHGESRVLVGRFASDTGLHIDGCHDNHHAEDIGITVCLRHEHPDRRSYDESQL